MYIYASENRPKVMIQKIDTKRFISTFCEIGQNDDRRFCFVLGAGASRSSGIRTGGELAVSWLEEMQKSNSVEHFHDFIAKHGIDVDNPASKYSEIYQERFSLDRANGFHYINREMEKARPGYGYSVLAQILAEKHHNIVITTNFDSLTEEALYTYTDNRPLVCGHELLAEFAKPSMNRPLIMKIHRDRFLNPQSMPEEIESMNKAWIEALNHIFRNCIPVFIGYGGNDGSLMGYLDQVSVFDNIFWCERKGINVSEPVNKFLEKNNGKPVEIEGFDELMFLLQDGMKLPLLDKKITTIAEDRSKKYKDVVERIRLTQSESTNIDAKAAAGRLVEKVDPNDWWWWELKAEEAKDNDEKNRIYLEALDKLPNSAEISGNYANFLYQNRKDYDQAEKFYKNALEIDSNNAANNGNYAVFLKDIRKGYDHAEKFYKNALEINSDDANSNGNYAIFLKDIRKDYGQAEKFYKKALEINLYQANDNGNYAGFLLAMNRREESERYLKLAEQNCDDKTLSSELLFYRYAHFEENRTESLKKLKDLICSGVRSIGFGLQDNADTAIKNGHPEPELLQRLADIITKDAPVGDLCE